MICPAAAYASCCYGNAAACCLRTPWMRPAIRSAGAEGEGFHLRVETRLRWLAYPAPVRNLGEARQALVTMARAPG